MIDRLSYWKLYEPTRICQGHANLRPFARSEPYDPKLWSLEYFIRISNIWENELD